MSSFSSTIDNQESRVYQIGNSLIRNVTGEGLELSPNGLSVDISPGYCDIDGKFHETTEVINQVMQPRKAGLIYAKKSVYSECPQFGVVEAQYPEPDDNTVAQWRFNTAGNIPNYAVGKSAIAVVNDLVPSGTLTKVDGWCDYAMQGDGSTGYYVSQNSTGFPIGASHREVDILFTINALASSNKVLFSYGPVTANKEGFYCYYTANTGNVMIAFGGTDINTGYILTVGQTYFISMLYDGLNCIVYINGNLIFKTSIVLATQTSQMFVGNLTSSPIYYAPVTFHYIELRDKCRTSEQIASISNKLCLPCFYTAPQAEYPQVAEAGYHEWKFDETSGTTVADSAGTLNGTATGTTIVDSEVGLGKARKFNGTSDVVTLSNYQFQTSHTVIAVVKPNSISGYQGLMGNFNSSGTSYGISNNGNGKLSGVVNGTWTSFSTLTINTGVANFCAFVANNGLLTAYLSPTQFETASWIPNTTVTQTLVIGNLGTGTNSTSWFNGDIDYLAIIPRALSQAEIAQIYNKLMKQGKRDIREILPSNSISLGFARTNSSQVIDYSDFNHSYAYGIRYADKRNQRVFSGYKYFANANQYINFSHPFGTENISISEIWYKSSLDETRHSVIDAYWSSRDEGLWIKEVNNNFIKIGNGGGNIICAQNSYNGVAQTKGYIGCYAEVLE